MTEKVRKKEKKKEEQRGAAGEKEVTAKKVCVHVILCM